MTKQAISFSTAELEVLQSTLHARTLQLRDRLEEGQAQWSTELQITKELQALVRDGLTACYARERQNHNYAGPDTEGQF